MLSKPIYVVFTVLELSKSLMYDFHYNLIKIILVLNCYTDSLTYEIKSKKVYEDFFKHQHLFDLSNYPKDSKFLDTANEGVIGNMKDVHKRKSINLLD